MLLENGGDPNIPDNCNGSTPVHMAAKLGKFLYDVLYVGTSHIFLILISNFYKMIYYNKLINITLHGNRETAHKDLRLIRGR